MKKTLIYTVTAIVVLAGAFPAFAKGSNGSRGNGNSGCANCQNRAAATKPACDGTGPKGQGTGNQRPMDGRDRQYQKDATVSQPAPAQTEQAPPPNN